MVHWVSVLSKITNHCGTHLLPRALQHSWPSPNNPYTGHNHSQLLWPHQPAPGPNAWRMWNKVIEVLYLQPNSYALSQPHGKWTQDYATDYNWVWHICPQPYILFQQHNGKWIPFIQWQQLATHIQYQLYTSNTSDPSGTVLVTPLILSDSIHVQLLVIPVVQTHPPQLQRIPLATQQNTPDSAWASSLWHDMQLHTHTDQLQDAIINNNRIIIVSNAAVHTTGQATCAWIIWAQTELWSGKGYLPGLHDETTLAWPKHIMWLQYSNS